MLFRSKTAIKIKFPRQYLKIQSGQTNFQVLKSRIFSVLSANQQFSAKYPNWATSPEQSLVGPRLRSKITYLIRLIWILPAKTYISFVFWETFQTCIWILASKITKMGSVDCLFRGQFCKMRLFVWFSHRVILYLNLR